MRASISVIFAAAAAFVFTGSVTPSEAKDNKEKTEKVYLFGSKKDDADATKSKSKSKVADKQTKTKKKAKVAKAKTPPKKSAKTAKATKTPEKKLEKRTLFSKLFENTSKQDKPSKKQLASKSLNKTDTLALAPTTMEFDSVAAQKAAAAKGLIDPKFDMQVVSFSGYKKGTIVIDSQNKFLYLVEGWGKARRYGVAVGREGLGWTGTATVHDKTEWPRWIPTKEMIERDPGHYKQYEDGMDGGPTNPLGARAMYLWQGNKDTYIRIHGTTAPSSIGRAASNGCFRMLNEHVIDLYSRVPVGTTVVVL